MILYFLLTSLVSGWGGDGHRLISTVAAGIMNEEALRFIEKTVNGDIGTASLWADTLDAETRYPRSGAYHFSNTPYRQCSAFEFERYCGFGQNKGICIVTGLADAISRAIDMNVEHSVRADALKFILHLMADIHQPLHTGFRADSGGLRVLLGRPARTSLHYIWDNWMIDELRRHYSESVEEMLQNQIKKNGGRFEAGLRAKSNMTDILSSDSKISAFVASLASETATTVTCNSGYKNANNKWIGVGATIDEAYFTSRQPILVVQLLKASVRLAILVEGIASKLMQQRRVAKERRRAELFSAVSKPGSFASPNIFEGLFVEFDPDEIESSSETPIMTVVPSVARAPASTVNDTEVIEKAIREAQAERESYIFSGVDLSQVNLHVHEGRLIVTNLTLKEYLRTTAIFKYVPIQTVTRAGEIKKSFYEFDGVLFATDPEDELTIRTMLKISGVDPRIDITDYIGSIRTHRRAEDSFNTLVRVLLGPVMIKEATSGTITKEALFKRISEMGSKLLWKRLDEFSVAVVHFDTMKTWQRKSARIRFAKLAFFATRGSHTKRQYTQLAFIDPLILNQAVSSDDNGEIVAFMNREAMKRPMFSSKTYDHMMWEELLEISKESQLQWWGFGAQESRKYIHWVFEMSVRDIASGISIPMVMAIRKGFFNSTDEFISHLELSDS